MPLTGFKALNAFLIKLEASSFLASGSVGLVQGLLEERDDVADVWHLLALANHGCCEFDRALELLVRFLSLFMYGQLE